jgi:hypothetical protein
LVREPRVRESELPAGLRFEGHPVPSHEGVSRRPGLPGSLLTACGQDGRRHFGGALRFSLALDAKGACAVPIEARGDATSDVLRDGRSYDAANGPLTRVSTARRTLKGNKAHGRIDRRTTGNGFAAARTRRWSNALKVTAPLGIASDHSRNGAVRPPPRQRGGGNGLGLVD